MFIFNLFIYLYMYVSVYKYKRNAHSTQAYIMLTFIQGAINRD